MMVAKSWLQYQLLSTDNKSMIMKAVVDPEFKSHQVCFIEKERMVFLFAFKYFMYIAVYGNFSN